MKTTNAKIPLSRRVALLLTLATVSHITLSMIDGETAPAGGKLAPVFALREGGGRTCTGVLVAPRLILTAAHCADGRLRISTAANGTDVTRKKFRGVMGSVQTYKANPGYDKRSEEPGATAADKNRATTYDIGYVVLKSPITAVTPATVRIFQSSDETRAHLMNKKLTVTGYGYKTHHPDGDYNLSEAGTKRYGYKMAAYAGLDAITFSSRTDGKQYNLLQGDSGGPVFSDDEAGFNVVGINHSSQKDASGSTAHALTQESVCWAEKSSGIDIPGVDCP